MVDKSTRTEGLTLAPPRDPLVHERVVILSYLKTYFNQVNKDIEILRKRLAEGAVRDAGRRNYTEAEAKEWVSEMNRRLDMLKEEMRHLSDMHWDVHERRDALEIMASSHSVLNRAMSEVLAYSYKSYFNQLTEIFIDRICACKEIPEG